MKLNGIFGALELCADGIFRQFAPKIVKCDKFCMKNYAEDLFFDYFEAEQMRKNWPAHNSIWRPQYSA